MENLICVVIKVRTTLTPCKYFMDVGFVVKVPFANTQIDRQTDKLL
jgi:hypothetical protein